MNKRIFAASLVLIGMLSALTACQLAMESVAPEDARLIGVFVSTEHIDLFDNMTFENVAMGWGQPDFSAIFQPQRLYAEWDVNFHFPGIEGMAFFSAMSPPVEGVFSEGVMAGHSSAGVSGNRNDFHFGDNYTRVVKEGTIYIVPGSHTVVYVNPVFQTGCGRVFLEPGGGFSGMHNEAEGSVFSQTMTETTEITVNGVENTYSMSVTINVASMFAPKKIVVVQMDDASRIVSRVELAPGEVPMAFYTEAGVEYVIIEAHRDTGHNPVTRELISRGENGVATFAAREDDIIVRNWMEIVWE